MSLLKEGDGVNFQKASCTLDGCVKIYTSRVDSVATDTGKLLSGLAESGSRKRRSDAADIDGDDEDGDGEGEDGQRKRKKRANRSAESTLAKSFAELQNKKMELELSVDPLFKKASADFDEGGAKGLLLNVLAIDAKGRIVFDSSDDANDATPADTRATPAPDEIVDQQEEEVEEAVSEDVEIDITGLAAKYFPDLSRLDEQDVCPSMKTFDLGDANGSMDLPFLKAPDDWKQDSNNDQDEQAGNRSGVFLDEDNALGFDDDDDGNMAGFDLPPETGFGEGGEAWANELARDPQARVHTIGAGDGSDNGAEGDDGAINTEERQYAVSMMHAGGEGQENILSYFDEALNKNWAGPEHWRIRRIKDVGKAPAPTKRKEKEPFRIDFAAPMSQSLADLLYTPATSKSTITLPKVQWRSKTRNLLPDDKHFNSRKLLGLFLRPKGWVDFGNEGKRTRQQEPSATPNGEVDQAYWASREDEANAPPEDEEVQGNYDADFFQDDPLPFHGVFDDDDEDAFADAREHFSPPAEDGAVQSQSMDGVVAATGDGGGETQLVIQSRRFRPEFVPYARTAKKVDVKRLKDEIWKGIGFEEVSVPCHRRLSNTNSTQIQAPPPPDAVDTPALKAVDGSLKFTQVMNDLQSVYPKQAMADISTSYGFICLLHLANEKGLVIENHENFEDLTIRKDFTADLSAGD